MPSPPENVIESGATPSSAGGLSVVTDLAVTGPRVYLRLQFLDPERVARDFPPGLTVRVGAQTYTVGESGRLTFPVPRAASPPDTFTLEFPAQARYVICEPPPSSPPDAGASPPSYPSLAGSPPAGPGRYLALPLEFTSPPGAWGLRHSDWTMAASPPGNATYSEGNIHHTDRTRDIGTAAGPVSLVLDPHWHFFRFEFFDRAFGYSTGANGHNRNRVSIPAVGLEGFRENPSPANADIPDTHSNWTVGSANALLQCLPWILQRTPLGSALPALSGQPSAGRAMSLRFQLSNSSYVFSKSAAEREIQEVTDATKLQPGPERLKYYDLPEWWKSRNYYARPCGGAAKFFRELVAGDIAAAADPARYIAFSLDDLVLLVDNAGALEPLAAYDAAVDRVVLFHHRFDSTVGGSTPHGIFNPLPDTDANALAANIPSSDVEVVGFGTSPPAGRHFYIHQYPDWTRLVVTQGSLFDVFDRRSPDSAGAEAVVGARGAVRWKDGTGPPGVNTEEWDGVAGAWVARAPGTHSQPWVRFMGIPPRIDVPTANPLFSMQPFYSLRMPRTWERYDITKDRQIGRFDIALLRCCDLDGDGHEVAVNLHYLKSRFDFSAAGVAAELAATPITEEEFANQISINVANRWNGNDAVNNCRARLLPRVTSPPDPLKVHVVWFAQSVRFAHAHFNISIQPPTNARDNRGSYEGMGDSTTNTYESFANNWFTTAHESGHMNGLPDDYNERWSAASYTMASFVTLHAGDPYEADGRTEAGDNADAAMMNGNRQLRNRYFWHAAEWVRLVTGKRLKVHHRHTSGAEYEYWLPEHADTAVGRNYYEWPLAARMSANLPSPAAVSPPVAVTASPPAGLPTDQFDLYLFSLGVDRYSAEILQKAGAVPPLPAFDGMLVVAVRLRCQLPADANFDTEGSERRDLLTNISAFARQFLNRKWYVEGHLGNPPDQHTFTRCALFFAPQFLVSNHPFYGPNQVPVIAARTHSVDTTLVDVDPALAARLEAEYGFNFDLDVRQDPGGPSATWDPDAANRRLLVRYSAVGDLQAIMNAQFPTFLGLPGTDVAGLTTAQLETVVRQIIPDGVVRTL